MSILAWIISNKKSVAFIMLCAVLGTFYGYHKYAIGKLKKEALTWQERAKMAEEAVASMLIEKERLQVALSEQEQATASAMASRKTVYRTVQKEVAADENTRTWYNTPVPDSLQRLLKNGAPQND